MDRTVHTRTGLLRSVTAGEVLSIYVVAIWATLTADLTPGVTVATCALVTNVGFVALMVLPRMIESAYRTANELDMADAAGDLGRLVGEIDAIEVRLKRRVALMVRYGLSEQEAQYVLSESSLIGFTEVDRQEGRRESQH